MGEASHTAQGSDALTVVIPVHNEAAHLAAFVEAFVADLGPLRDAVAEVLLVENGSRDATAAVAQQLAQRFRGWIRVVQIRRASYGEALKLGIREARAPWVAILECDLLDAAFLRAARAAAVRSGAAFVLASKRHAESADRRPLKRRMITWGFNALLRVALRFPGTDTHGLKLIRSDVAKFLTGISETTDEVFQTELVLLAYRLGWRVIETPVAVREQRPTPFPILKRIPKVLRLVHAVRHSLGRFGDAASVARVLEGAPARN